MIGYIDRKIDCEPEMTLHAGAEAGLVGQLVGLLRPQVQALAPVLRQRP